MKKYFIFCCIILLFFVTLVVIQKKREHSTSSPTPHIRPTTATNSSDQTALSKGAVPQIPFNLPDEYTIHIFASNLGTPRDLQFSPDGTLLVSNPSGNDVYALPDSNHDGIADSEKEIISGENHVHGLAFFHQQLFIADVDKVVRYNWNGQSLTATKDKDLFPLPQNSDHNNRTLVFNSSGQLFISVGSTCNVCNESPQQGGSVWISDSNGTTPQIFASGLRNAAFLAMKPTTDELWGTEMGRDYLGDNIPPDEINIIKQGENYGWPDCYGDRIHDTNFAISAPDPCSNTIPPIYQIPAHSAPLGLVFINSSQFPSDWQGDLLVAYHGDWNRSTPTGFKVVHLKVAGDTITASSDFLTGFLQSTNASNASGRPVDLAFDKQGNLYLSDDKAGNVYIIQKKQ